MQKFDIPVVVIQKLVKGRKTQHLNELEFILYCEWLVSMKL